MAAFAVGSPVQTLRSSFQTIQVLAQHHQGVGPFGAAPRTPAPDAALAGPGRWVCLTSVPLLLCLRLTLPMSPDFTARCRHRRRLRPSAPKRWPWLTGLSRLGTCLVRRCLWSSCGCWSRSDYCGVGRLCARLFELGSCSHSAALGIMQVSG